MWTNTVEQNSQIRGQNEIDTAPESNVEAKLQIMGVTIKIETHELQFRLKQIYESANNFVNTNR